MSGDPPSTSVGDRNRDRFDDPDVVDDYTTQTELTRAETVMFSRHVRSGARILDLGVGTGRTTRWLNQRGSSYVDLDYAPNMIEAARGAHPDTDLRLGDAADLSAFADGSFDAVVFSFNGIDYLDNDARTRCLHEIHRVLAADGRFVFSMHNARALLASRAKVDGSVPRKLAVVALSSARRMRQRLPDPSFRTGEGWMLDPSRGGLVTHVATPATTARELTAHGFRLVETLNGDHPARPSTLRTPWWYYAATPT